MHKFHWTLLVLFGAVISRTSGTPIPSWLVDCYRGNETEPFHPNTLQTLIEIIRKLEDSEQTLMDIRTTSAMLIHRLRLDGIERLPGVKETPSLTPYGVSGFQYPKLKLILQMVSTVPTNSDIFRILDRGERCHLHRMLSSTVDNWRRADEHQTCLFGQHNGDLQPGVPKNSFMHTHKVSMSDNNRPTQSYSRCPIEKGSIRSIGYGPIAPGIVIASIASGLQPQTVPTDQMPGVHYQHYTHLETMQKRNSLHLNLYDSLSRIDNTYAASLAINLAEICLNQGDESSNGAIGVKGYWNDTYLPRIRYLAHPYSPQREMTDSEILSGIDGLFLSQEISKLRINGNRLRLSQVLDEYYSARGLPFVLIENMGNNNNQYTSPIDSPNKPFQFESNRDFGIFQDPSMKSMPSNRHGITNACHRMTILRQMKRNKLKHEVFQLAQVLRLSTKSLTYDDDALYNSCNVTVDRFFRYSANLVNQLPKCDQIPEQQLHPKVDMTLITDVSRNDYENARLISFIGEFIDVSVHGSMLSIIDGSRDSLVIHRARGMMNITKQLKQSFKAPHTSSSLSLALATMLRTLTQQAAYEQQNHVISGLPQVALIFAQGPRITETDFVIAQKIISHSVRAHPDLHYVFVANDKQLIHDLFQEANNEKPINQTKYFVIQEGSTEIEKFGLQLKTILAQFARRIVASGCKEVYRDYNEQYLTPSEDVIYRINTYYLTGGDRVQIQFDGVSHGTFTVCMAYNKYFERSECQTNSDYQTIVFDVITCEDQNVCDTVYFKISVEQSSVKCIERGCRHQDQVRFYIRQQGLGCTSSANSHIYSYCILVSMLFITIISSSLSSRV